jgi:hypothetical protein
MEDSIMTTTFLNSGFNNQVTACSLTPQVDGYIGTFNTYPYHIHPTATPAQWILLEHALADNLVTVNPYVPPVVNATELWKEFQAQAQLALDKSDLVAMRCFKAGIAFPTAWQSYVIALRAIVSASTGTASTLPTQPSYPVGN